MVCSVGTKQNNEGDWRLSEYEELKSAGTTRGRIIVLLRRAGRTVSQLARELDITDNAVRAQLITLERDGLVERSGMRRSGSKPAVVYKLTLQAERLFPKGYGIVLRHLLDTLDERWDSHEIEALVREAGGRMGSALKQSETPPAANGDSRERLSAATRVMNDLGGLAQLEETGDNYSICGYTCPVIDVVQSHPEICLFMEAMLKEFLGMPVRQRCQRDESVGCWFEIAEA
jgi:predicted ArsR family transcriptional regulator